MAPGAGEPIAALKKVGKYIRSVHCKDGTWAKNPGKEWGAEVPLGQGDVGMENYLRTLLEIGYTGPVSLELFNAQYWAQDPYAVVRTGFEKSKRWFDAG